MGFMLGEQLKNLGFFSALSRESIFANRSRGSDPHPKI